MVNSERSAAQRQQNAHVISAVCVDVSELLRRAAAAADCTDTPKGLMQERFCASTLPSSGLPSIKQQRSCGEEASALSTNGIPGSTFWARGNSAGGPPPLSPADPTILHAILSNPPPTVTADGSGKAATASGKQRTWRPSRALPQSSFSRTRAKATSVRFSPHLQESSHLVFRSTTQQYLRGDNHSFSLAPSSADEETRALRGEATHMSIEDNKAPIFFAPPVRNSEDAEAFDLTPVAQQALNNVLSHLRAHTAHLLINDQPLTDGAGNNGNAAGLSSPIASSQLRYWTSPASTACTQLSVNPPQMAAPLPRRTPGVNAANGSTQFSAGEAHGEPCTKPTLNGKGVRSVRARAALPLTLRKGTQSVLQCSQHQEQRLANVPGVAWHGGDVRRGELSSNRRTVPPAFRRQLQFSEAAPTTRRPKRK